MANNTFNKTLPLTNSSVHIPQLGFGVYLSPPDVCKASCLSALQVGYRHIDTAQFYANEAQVGQALKESGLKRSDVFITTKILSASGSVDKSYQKCLESIRKIDDREDGYVDLFLIHSPNAGSKARKEMWLALEKVLEQGKAKSIGVSNFGVGHINELKSFATTWPPPVNQIEVCLRDFLDPSLLQSHLQCIVTTDTASPYSFTRGASNGPLSHFAKRTTLSLKPTHPWFETTKPMTPLWSRWPKSTTKPPHRCSSATLYKRAGSPYPRVTVPSISNKMPTCLALNWMRMM